MMKTNSTVVLLALMTCSVWAWAQEAPGTRSASQAQGNGTLWSANESIGANVIGANGEDLGEVDDIVMDRNKNRIAYLIVSYGGILDVGDKHFAVPWQAFGQTADRELTLRIDPEKLKNAPGFEKGTLPNTADPLFHKEVHSFYNAKPYSVAEQERARAEERATRENAAEHTGDHDSDWENLWDWDSWVDRGDDTTWARRLDELIGTDIENAQGDTIAELEDVIVDSREARAAYAVVSYGGTLGLFEDTAIIPWNTLRLDLAEETYVTDITHAQLEQAEHNDNEYRDLEDRNFAEALYGTFGTRPHWEEFGYENETDQAARTAAAKARVARANEAKANAEANAKSNPNVDDASAPIDSAANLQDGDKVTGTVVSVGSYPGSTQETESERGVRVRIRTESGSICTVHLAKNEELQRQELTLKRGDKVVITCENSDYRGRKVLSARELEKGGRTVKFEN